MARDGRVIDAGSRRNDGGRGVLTALRVQVPSQGAHIAQGERVVRRELVLKSQVEGLLIRGLEVILPPV